MTDPTLVHARELAAYKIPRGKALETGILNGYCDEGSLVQDELAAALKALEENIPDD